MILGSEELSPGSVVGYTLWHREAREKDYPIKSTCTLSVPNRRFVVTGLTPGTEYHFKVISFNGMKELNTSEVQCSTGTSEGKVVPERSQSPATNCSSLSNPSSVEDESNSIIPYSDQNDDRADNYLSVCKETDKTVSANLAKDVNNCSICGEGGTAADAASVLDEEHAIPMAVCMPSPDVLMQEKKHSAEGQLAEEMSNDNGSDTPAQTGLECVPYMGSSDAGLPITPCKMDTLKDIQGRNGRLKSNNKDMQNGIIKGDEPQDGSTSKKRSGERQDKECTATDLSDGDFEHYVKVIRWLECEGHIEKNFRQKFLTWYSLRATPQEVRVVKVFVDTFIEDPASLAEQLVDTFSECISSKRLSFVPPGFCMKLWH